MSKICWMNGITPISRRRLNSRTAIRHSGFRLACCWLIVLSVTVGCEQENSGNRNPSNNSPDSPALTVPESTEVPAENHSNGSNLSNGSLPESSDPASNALPEPGLSKPAVEPSTAVSTISYSGQPTNALDFLRGKIDYDLNHLIHFKTQSAPYEEELRTKLIEFVEGVFRRSSYSNEDPQWQRLFKLRQSIEQRRIAIGIEPIADPLFLFCSGLVDFHCGASQAGIQKIVDSRSLFQGSQYPAHTQMLVYQKLMEYRFAEPSEDFSDDEVAEILTAYQAVLIEWLTQAKSLQTVPAHHRYVVNEIHLYLRACKTFNQPARIESFHEWFVQQTHLPRWIRNIIRGHCHLLLAILNIERKNAQWVYKQKNQTLDHIKKAEGFFRQAYEINPYFPESSACLMLIAFYRDEAQLVDDWFEKGLKAQADYYDLFRLRLLMIAQDLEKGSAPAMLELARKLAQENHSDTTVPTQLLQAFFAIRDQFPEDHEELLQIAEDSMLKAELLETVDRCSACDHDLFMGGIVVPKTYFLTLKAVWQMETGDLPAADETFSMLENNYSKKALEHVGLTTTSCEIFRCKSYAATSEYASEAEELHRLSGDTPQERLENLDEIRKITDLVLAENTHPIGSLFFRQVRDRVEAERSFERGNRVAYSFDNEMSLWKGSNIQQFHFQSESTAMIDNTIGKSEFSLESICHTPGAKSIELEIDFDSQNVEPPLTHPVVAVSIGKYRFLVVDDQISFEDFCIGLSAPNATTDETGRPALGQLLIAWRNVDKKEYYYDVAVRAGKNKLLIFVCEGYLEVFLNDDFIFRSAPKFLDVPLDQVRISNPASSGKRGQVQISNLQVTRLDFQQPPFDDPDALLIYRQNQFDGDPENKWFAFWLAQALHTQAKNDEAIERYLDAVKNGLPKSKVGFFVGDIFEQQGELEKAIEWYQIAANLEVDDRTRLCPRKYTDSYSGPQQWAAFRLAWLTLTSPDPEIRKSLDFKTLTSPLPPEHVRWLGEILKAQEAAIEERFDDARQIAIKMLPKCTPKLEKRIMEMVAAYDAKTPFVHPSDQLPIYFDVDCPTPLHPFLEHSLSSDERAQY